MKLFGKSLDKKQRIMVLVIAFVLGAVVSYPIIDSVGSRIIHKIFAKAADFNVIEDDSIESGEAAQSTEDLVGSIKTVEGSKTTEAKSSSSAQARRTPTEIKVVSDWITNVKANIDNYLNSYTKEQLVTLADSGDVTAMGALRYVYVDEGNLEKAFEYAELGAINGSIHALESLADLSMPPVLNPPLHPLEYSKKRAILAISYLKLIERLGIGRLFVTNAKKTFIENTLINQYGEAGMFSQADMNLIEDLADAINQELVTERESLGIIDFEYDIPKEVLDFADN